MRPTSTYRLQLRPAFGFTQAAELVPYLRELGAGAVYSAPMLQAAPGSQHGYNVVDPTRVSADLGGEEGRLALSAALKEQGLDWIVDIVPNHVGVEVPETNPWWWDVLTYGEKSPYARYFDIDWGRGPIRVPVLGEDGEDALSVKDGKLCYHEHRFPISPGTEGGTPTEVHGRQNYRLIDWRRGNSELNYRRFFDVATLAAVRVEDPEIFEATHREILRWVEAGQAQGIRVDHPDGLSDPTAYLTRLRERAGSAWLLAEKILGPDERLPQDWPIAGTTGYEAMREVCGLFIDPAGEDRLTKNAAKFGVPGDLHTLEYESKKLVATTILAAEMTRIAALLPDLTDARDAVIELLCAFPVYRSYLPEGAADLEKAIATATGRAPGLTEPLAAIHRRMLDDPHGELAIRIQQTSGMVMAKGVEDTTFYRYNRFVALNEVGGDPDHFGYSPAEFHAAQTTRLREYPDTMNSLSTHDTKRAEDVRARLAVLSEMPDEFVALLRRWAERYPLRDREFELLAWQNLLGAWPISKERLTDYLFKAAKEAKHSTTWAEPDEEFDASLGTWAQAVLADAEITGFAEQITRWGRHNSLGQKLVQLTMPGVPDVYQGTELWDHSLVDPDNRRDVDFARRRELLTAIDDGLRPEIDDSGAAKLLVVSRALRLRRDRPELFTDYAPLHAEGPAAEHLVAFRRSPGLVVVATRLPLRLHATGGWRDTTLALGEGTYADILTGRPVSGTARLTEVLDTYPVALLVR
ncbi:malto-oligosyltrehalose synthase [Pseudonocardiaceae bacterium YIM PH 21723]|nr:malto-oligosyltrehalose synthase [Pseudonocardiaceae bacterium YIM PH 21723]